MKKALSWALAILLFSLAIITLVVFIVGLILEEEEVLETILFTSAAVTLFVILALLGCWNLPRTNNEQKLLKEYEMEHTLRVRLENINYELVREKQENEKKAKALEIISKAYGDYANHKISEYELIMIVGENTTY